MSKYSNMLMFPSVPVELPLRGHPDKICDTVSDIVLDTILEDDPEAKVAVETMLKGNELMLAGEVTTFANGTSWKRKATGKIDQLFLDLRLPIPQISSYISEQSRQINGTVLSGAAGDQAIVYGYSLVESPLKVRMPSAYTFAAKARDIITAIIDDYPFMRYDGKVLFAPATNQLYVSVQHTDEVDGDYVRQLFADELVESCGPCSVYVNLGNDFVFGGADADAGVTGRKIVADAYGPAVPVGGGAFSGKDLSKVDRMGAYAARKIANDISKKLFNAGGDFYGMSVVTTISYAYGCPDLIDLQVSVLERHKAPLSDKSAFVTQVVRENREMYMEWALPFKSKFYMSGFGDKWLFSELAAYGHFGYPEIVPMTWENSWT